MFSARTPWTEARGRLRASDAHRASTASNDSPGEKLTSAYDVFSTSSLAGRLGDGRDFAILGGSVRLDTVDGVVLSNHGGRQLDGSVSAIETLPEVAQLAKGRMSVFLDGGFRRGSDIVKALLLGADGVLLGRAGLYGLAAGKGPGAMHAIEILRTEVDRTLGLLGCSRLDELSPDLIHDPRWRAAAQAVLSAHLARAEITRRA